MTTPVAPMAISCTYTLSTTFLSIKEVVSNLIKRWCHAPAIETTGYRYFFLLKHNT
jgi:hypothetical protein